MLSKLTFRNVKRSAGDYLIYLITMTVIAALMFAFHGMMFSEDMKAIYSDLGIFVALTLMASFFIMFIIIWLVHYMVNFMLEKRGREFGTYMLLGMKKKQIARIFRWENIILGFLSMLLGVIPGFIFQKVFVNVFYSILDIDYHITLNLNLWGVLITVGILVFSYVLALWRVKRRFKKMHIRDFIYMDKQNEQVIHGRSTWKKVFVLIAAAYIVFFYVMVFTAGMTIRSVWGYIIGLAAAIYLLYAGLSSFFVSYIKSRPDGIYYNARLFVFRQLASKIRTMRFTMGTLTILFTAALLGWTIVMMFADYQKRELNHQAPFDVAVMSDQPDETFAEQLMVINENTEVIDYHSYIIYENGTNAVNDFMYARVDGTYKNDVFIDGKYSTSTYFGYDTYIGVSDYNYIRGMLGYEEIDLQDGNYILHGKEKFEDEWEEMKRSVAVKAGDRTYHCQAVNLEPLSQEGINGADYIIVVPDEAIADLTPYYSVLTVDSQGEAPVGLREKLREVKDYFDETSSEYLYAIETGTGSNQILTMADDVMVASYVRTEGSFIIVAMCFILAYIGIVFLCAALTILAVQQLSDSAKYRFRYMILKQLGMNKREIRKVVLKQLTVYYLCPYVVSLILSMFIGLFASERFVYYTGIQAADFTYYILAVLAFSIVYAAYFITSYIGFIRNLEAE